MTLMMTSTYDDGKRAVLKASSRLLVLNLSPRPQMVRLVMNFDLIERVDSYDEISIVFQFS